MLSDAGQCTQSSCAQIPRMGTRVGYGHGIIMATSAVQLHMQVMTAEPL